MPHGQVASLLLASSSISSSIQLEVESTQGRRSVTLDADINRGSGLGMILGTMARQIFDSRDDGALENQNQKCTYVKKVVEHTPAWNAGVHQGVCVVY